MGDYIKREDALEAIRNAPIAFLGTRIACEDLVIDIPAADVVEQKRGHGRLIDADALLLKLLTAESGKVYDYCYPCKEVIQAIKDSPTIIERETN